MFPMSHAGVPDLTLQKLSRDQEPLMPRTSSPAPRAVSHEPEKDTNDTTKTPGSIEGEEISPITSMTAALQDPFTPPTKKQKHRSRSTIIKDPKSKSKKPSTSALDLQVLAAMGDQTAKAKLEKQRRPKYRKLAKTEEGRKDLIAWRSLGDGVAREMLESIAVRGRGRKRKGKEGQVEWEGTGREKREDEEGGEGGEGEG